MRNVLFLLLVASAGMCLGAQGDIAPSPSVIVRQGGFSGAIISRNGRTLVVYGDPSGIVSRVDMVLFTDSRRDVVWAATKLIEAGASCAAPAADVESFTRPGQFWANWRTERFHDYAQQTTKVPVAPLKVDRKVEEGYTFKWQDLDFEVLDTPGYCRHAVSYFTTIDGKKYGFVGNIIYEDGKLFDLYSLQDAVKEANIGGYHGWAGRMGELIASLRKVQQRKCDVLVPARGRVIYKPDEAIEKLIERLRKVYENYLSISAGRWYFKDNYDKLAARVLAEGDKVAWMSYAPVIEEAPPAWIVPINNSRLIVSADKSGFLVDCGSKSIMGKVEKMLQDGQLRQVCGMFVTHYHDDHTDCVAEAAAKFGCRVYCSWQQQDVLRNPAAYRLPAMTSNAIDVVALPDGHRMKWKEFELTFYYLPGQTIYHDGLLVERETGDSVFFIGDSFTPSGIDDYCLLNRNLMHEGMGYLYCLDMLKAAPQGCLFINEHVLEPFRFSDEQIEHIQRKLRQRRGLLEDLLAWEEAHYGIDERWARIYPYGQTVRSGQDVRVAVRVFNHGTEPRVYRAQLHAGRGVEFEPETASIEVEPLEEAEIVFEATVSGGVGQLQVITADVQFGKWYLKHWCEGLIEIVGDDSGKSVTAR